MDGWSKKRLIEITKKIGSGATPRGGSDAYKDSGISLFRSLNVHDKTFKEKNLAFIDEDQASKLSNVEVQEGDVLLNITGASIARCCIAPSELLPARVNQHVAIIRPKSDYIDSNFLVYLLVSKQYKDALLNTGEKAGATRQALTKQQLENFEVIIPKFSEQKRIVAILDEAFEGIDKAIANAENNLANSRELFESYLNAIFTQKGDGWITTTVGKLVDQRILDKPLDGNHGEIHPKKSDFVKSGVPFIMASDLVDGMVDQVNCNFITLEQANSLRKGFAKDGDVLLSHKGTIGRVAVLKTSHPSVVLTPQVTYYRVIDKSVIYNRYLYYFFHSPYFQNEIKTIAGAGSTRAYIGITSQLQLKISYPKIDDQKRYADSFDALISETQRLESIYRQKIAALNELKQSILQKAFTGELTADTANQTTKAANEGIAA